MKDYQKAILNNLAKQDQLSMLIAASEARRKAMSITSSVHSKEIYRHYLEETIKLRHENRTKAKQR